MKSRVKFRGLTAHSVPPTHSRPLRVGCHEESFVIGSGMLHWREGKGCASAACLLSVSHGRGFLEDDSRVVLASAPPLYSSRLSSLFDQSSLQIQRKLKILKRRGFGRRHKQVSLLVI